MNLPLNTSANISDPIAQARYNMIEQQIRPWNVLDADVLDLLAVVRREDFNNINYLNDNHSPPLHTPLQQSKCDNPQIRHRSLCSPQARSAQTSVNADKDQHHCRPY